MMIRIACPICQGVMQMDDRHLGEEVECAKCLSRFESTPQQVLRSRAEPSHDSQPRSGNSALWSLLFGIAAILTSPCLGFGAAFGFFGFFLGWAGLRSPRRTLGIWGMVCSVTGVIFSLGMIAVLVIELRTLGEVIPAKPDGTKAPFVHGP
jgi:hypothetical protein